MSLSIVRRVNEQYPLLLQQNVNYTCYQFIVKVIAELRAAGHSAFHICKTAGEGQYTPPGFQPRNVVGHDGKGYLCTGVSHDAIWCDGLQVDCIAQGNDSPDPIGMLGIPVWNLIPEQYWRPNNPPLIEGIPPSPQPPPAPPSKILPKGEAYAQLQALNAFYQAPEGLQRPGGLVRPDSEGRMVADMEAIAQWFYQIVIEGIPLEQVLTQIRNSDEWRSKHP